MYQERISRVLAAMERMGLEQMLVSDPDSIWYLTGYDVFPFERLYAFYLRKDGQHKLFLNKLFPVPEAPYEQVWFSDTDDYLAILANAVDGEKDMGVDKDWPARFLLPLMAHNPSCKYVLASDCVDDARACKDAVERDLMREASRINDVVMERAAAYMKEGMTEREVADYIGADHTEVYMTREQVLESLEEVIAMLGTWDITTIRASMGMYLCCKAIHEQTDVRVLLTGEISDELFGYKYTDYAPSAQAFQMESKKRVDELYMYDVLRADRCISVNSLEARVPFGDLDFVRYVMSVDPKLKLNTYNMGKYLLRHAFEKDHLLPDDILWRQKAAFSDAVGHSMVDDLKAYAEEKYTDAEFQRLRQKYDYCTPFTKESLLYREIFEKYYPGQARMIQDFWMPNKAWEGCDVDDPSARCLANYGESGR